MMSPLRFMLVKMIFWAECLLFIWFYVHGSTGMQALWKMEKENDVLLHEKQELAVKVVTIEQDLATWDAQTFAKEKIARETLHMARPCDTVYYWS